LEHASDLARLQERVVLDSIPGAGYHASGAAGLASKVLLEQVPSHSEAPSTALWGWQSVPRTAPHPLSQCGEPIRSHNLSSLWGVAFVQAQEAAELGRRELEQAAEAYNKASAAKAKRQAALNAQTDDSGDADNDEEDADKAGRRAAAAKV
jgi:hypothetical protein